MKEVEFVVEAAVEIHQKWRIGKGIGFGAFVASWGIVREVAPCSLVGQACRLVQEVAVAGDYWLKLGQHCERKIVGQNMMLGRKDIRVQAHR
jgi:hypothetical protein